MLDEKSKKKLKDLHPLLVMLCNTIAEQIPIYVVCTYRDAITQNKAHDAGNSPHLYPNSKHNRIKAQAVDLAPKEPDSTIDWKNLKKFTVLAGMVLSTYLFYKHVFRALGYRLRWGGDWDMDYGMRGTDLGHFELVKIEKEG